MNPRIVVVGSANIDYLFQVAEAPRPGETILSESLVRDPGGKGANQAVASQRAGGKTHLVGCVGDDDDGAAVLRRLRAEGVDIAEVEILTKERTGIAVVTVTEAGENTIVVAPGANAGLGPIRVANALGRLLDPETVVVSQAEIPTDAIAAAAVAAESAHARFVLNLAPFVAVGDDLLARCDPLVINETEAEALLGTPVDDVLAAVDSCRQLSSRTRSVVITLGSRGAVWAQGDDVGHEPAPRVPAVVDTTGAGDAFIGALATALGRGESLADAVAAGVTAGSFAVTKVGAQSSYPRAGEFGYATTP